jgi:EAL domain-containing protein (putative c-di-GMP-specific phosphodiesterase class I)/serine/threonine protein kinase
MNTNSQNCLPAGFKLHWYEIQSVLGQGGFGITYHGQDTNLNRAVAIKEYFPHGHASRDQHGRIAALDMSEDSIFPWGLTRFIEEAQTLARLQQQNIVRVHNVFEDNGTAYMIMELEQGSSLADVIDHEQFRNEQTLLSVLFPILDGLEYIHSTGFIHRDLKPDNILLRDDMTPVVIDFGSAREAIGNETRQLTSIVSRGFAPVEQFGMENAGKQGPWTDIYSLGAVLYRIITGKMPKDALLRMTAMLETNEDPYKSIHCSTINKKTEHYSHALLDAVEKAMNIKAADRPQSIAEWRQLFPKATSNAIPKQSQIDGSNTEHQADTPDVQTEVINSGTVGELHDQTIKVSEAVAVIPEKEQLDFSQLRVLLVDDEVFVLGLGKRVLAKIGIEQVETANNGEEAIGYLDECSETPDIIICDLNMPGMDGVEFSRHLGERNIQSGIIFLSGEDKRILQTAVRLGERHKLQMLGSIQKPIQKASLMELIQKFDPDRAAVPAQQTIEAITVEELLAGLNNDAIELYYSPRVSLKDKTVIGVEVLPRWRHGQRGLLTAEAFMPLAQEQEQLDAVMETIWLKAMTQGCEWRADGLDFSMSVNYSSSSEIRLDLPEYIVAIVTEQGMDPASVIIEVKEDCLLRDINSSIEVLTRMRMMGLGLAIENFGSGKVSMEQLRDIPFSELKLDAALVKSAVQDNNARSLLESHIKQAKELELTIVADGVDTQQEWDLVVQLGCDETQGELISRPLSEQELVMWMESYLA